MTSPRPTIALAASAVLAALILSGCSAETIDPAAEEKTPSAAPVSTEPTEAEEESEKPDAADEEDPADDESDGDASDLSTVPGYAVGEFPPVPLFVLPDTSLLDQSADLFALHADDALADIPGVKASPAQCNADGVVISGTNTALLYGDGSGSFTGPDGAVENRGDGSGQLVDGPITIINNGDGTGSYVNGPLVIDNSGGGAGSYVDSSLTIELDGHGGGTSVNGPTTIQNNGDGSGTYVDSDITVQNNGDGSGSYVGPALTIVNNGDGTALVQGPGPSGSGTVKVDPLPPVPPLGSFPPVDALKPLSYCGTTLTFEDGVLFDFDKSDIRPDAASTLSTVAGVLGEINASQLIVSGHTDSIGDDAYNQDLSERRAQSVVDALSADGVTISMAAEGHGESRPVAANEVNGTDNPAGRQLNRRVEIFIPAVL